MKFGASLQSRLLGLLLLLLGMGLVAVVVHGYGRADRAAARDVDDRLRMSAALVLETIDPLSQRDSTAPPRSLSSNRTTWWASAPAFEIRTRDGRVMLRSTDFPPMAESSPPGFSTRMVERLEWRIFTIVDPDRGVMSSVAMNAVERAGRARNRFEDTLVPVMMALPLLGIAVLASVWLGLKPLRRIERAVRGVKVTELRRLDLDVRKMPRELGRLARTLNDLLDRQQGLMRHQRAFVAAAGHELRTPLAGCKTQLDVIGRTDDRTVRAHAMTKLGEALERMIRLVGQLMLFAKSEQSGLLRDARRFDLDSLIAEIVADDVTSTAAQHRRIDYVPPAVPVEIVADRELVRSMIENLLENAVRVSAVDDPVEVVLTAAETHVTIDICDRGPGLPDDQKEQVFDSFHQVARRSTTGAGLGLSIVKAIVEAHRGSVALEARSSGGICARVRLPRHAVDAGAGDRDHQTAGARSARRGP